MSALIAILILLLLGLVVLVVGAPLRRAGDGDLELAGETATDLARSVERDELEAAREAKYREIRDTELDFRTGKLSEEDYRATDAALRAEALEILDGLEHAAERGGSVVRPRDA
ncbi:MAG: hypothetical protein ACYDHN_09150 [Solirubrobacteraceae bacterium]